MSEKRTGLAIVVLQYSIVVRGLEKKLKDLLYKVLIIENFIEGISKCADDVKMYIVYVPDNIVKDDLKLKKLGMMVKMIVSTGKRAMIIGEHKAHDELLDAIPEINNFMWLDKPIDMENLDSIMEKALSDEAFIQLNNRKRILIVDDDLSYAKMVREWLRDDYRVDIVTAGMKAIGFISKLEPNDKVDLVLLDYDMPDVDGPKVLKMLRDAESTKDISVIFLTGNGNKEDVEKVMALKPKGYILKSARRDSLLEYVAKKI